MTTRRLDLYKVVSVLIAASAICLTVTIEGGKMIKAFTQQGDAITRLNEVTQVNTNNIAILFQRQNADHDKVTEHDQILRYLTGKPQPKHDYYSIIKPTDTNLYTLK